MKEFLEMHNYKVSIIVPIYNQEKYLNKSIPALLNQRYSNIEIVLVNDGSVDESKSIIEKYAQNDQRIVVVEKENGGLVDATISGIKVATGDYICFMDPDDMVGIDYIGNFVKLNDSNYDIISAGFYYENNEKLTPYFLSEDINYNNESIRDLSNTFLFNPSEGGISRKIFFSRWNKMYRTECVLQAVTEFESCRGISLGEDTIFTYIVLNKVKSVKIVSAPNSYFYNVGNQQSMMKNGASERHLKKAKDAFGCLYKFKEKYKGEKRQAYILYFYLIEALFERLKTSNFAEFKPLYQCLKGDKIYQDSLELLMGCAHGKKRKYDLILRKKLRTANEYLFFTDRMLNQAKRIKNSIVRNRVLVKNIKKCGLLKAYKLRKFAIDRENAFDDLTNQLPLLEKRILEIIQPCLHDKTDLSETEICKNVFVFWWDGFDTAPEIVKKCFESVKRAFDGCNVIQIDKCNYGQFTDINTEIINGFENGNISVQTFSDILRFNLLKNNGGVWIDATIFFTQPDNDILNGLQNKSFESLEFSSSNGFLSYKDINCNWSGYYIAARKNSVFVSVMDRIFREYYLKYNTYSIYFFIDAAFAICKLYRIDDGVLDLIRFVDADMFVLAKMLNSPYSEICYDTIAKVPQKLAWNAGVKKQTQEITFFQKLLNREA